MSGNGNAPVIIKRKKVVGGGGHHGGAWKVAIEMFLLRTTQIFAPDLRLRPVGAVPMSF